MTAPSEVARVDANAASPSIPSPLARPKSSTLTMPSAVILMFAGLRSRCVIPRVVRALGPLGYRPGARQPLRHWQPAAPDEIRQRVAADQLHHEPAAIAE